MCFCFHIWCYCWFLHFFSNYSYIIYKIPYIKKTKSKVFSFQSNYVRYINKLLNRRISPTWKMFGDCHRAMKSMKKFQFFSFSQAFQCSVIITRHVSGRCRSFLCYLVTNSYFTFLSFPYIMIGIIYKIIFNIREFKDGREELNS